MILLIVGFVVLTNKSDEGLLPKGECCTVEGDQAVDVPELTYCKYNNKFYSYSTGGFVGRTKRQEITEQQYLQGKKSCVS